MLRFDPRSFIILAAVLSLLCAFVFFVLRRSFPPTVQGIGQWGWSCLLMVPAAFLYTLRGTIPMFWSSFASNLLLIGGIMLMFASILRFTQRPVPLVRLAAILAGLAAILVWPTFVEDNFRLRTIIVSTADAGLLLASAWAIMRLADKRFAERFTMAAFVLAAILSGARSAAAFLQDTVPDPINGASVLQQTFLASFAVAVVMLTLGFLLMVNRQLQDRLEYAASHDQLTGILRRETFLEAARREMARAVRYKQPLALLMIDLDNFKSINDAHGHQTGDQVIIDFTRKAQKALRANDVIGRYGGEEFMALLPNTTQDGAYAVADRIRAMSGEQVSQRLPAYTVSIGIATLNNLRQPDIDTLIGNADEALFAAKRGGKNRIEMCR
jgi:diguanylate cyclase (GGDEF)-like protein